MPEGSIPSPFNFDDLDNPEGIDMKILQKDKMDQIKKILGLGKNDGLFIAVAKEDYAESRFIDMDKEESIEMLKYVYSVVTGGELDDLTA